MKMYEDGVACIGMNFTLSYMNIKQLLNNYEWEDVWTR